jgi:hypothetical protein
MCDNKTDGMHQLVVAAESKQAALEFVKKAIDEGCEYIEIHQASEQDTGTKQ